ncbi:MAG: metallophosphoesterase [Dechloromonas sp.]|nr:MAG: metallophosphoesterase [Dechloromonas sp.]
MKILHVADLHADHEWFDWVANEARKFDLLVIAGDLQNAFSNTGMHDQAKAIGNWLITIACTTIICSGNHDFWVGDKRVSVDVYAEGAWLKRLRHKGNIIGVDGDTFSYQVHPSHEWVKFAVNGWLDVPNLNERVDILVTHAPPMGCAGAASAEGRDNGDPELWPALQDHPPRLILSGHVHQPAQHACSWPPIEPSTVVLVPGCDEQSPIPNHWVIDMTIGQAVHSNGDTVTFQRP